MVTNREDVDDRAERIQMQDDTDVMILCGNFVFKLIHCSDLQGKKCLQIVGTPCFVAV